MLKRKSMIGRLTEIRKKVSHKHDKSLFAASTVNTLSNFTRREKRYLLFLNWRSAAFLKCVNFFLFRLCMRTKTDKRRFTVKWPKK